MTSTRQILAAAPVRLGLVDRRLAPLALADPAPLTLTQLRALQAAVGRELGGGLRQVRARVALWERRAQQIPQPKMRAEALLALQQKRGYADGSALFWTLPPVRDPRLLALLTDFQITANFLDQASEHGAALRGRTGRSLMTAFVDAVDVDGPVGAHFADHPWADDGGYLRALVASCRTGCETLPGYPAVRRSVLLEATRARVLELGHDPDPARRDASLERFAADEYGADHEMSWFELASGGAAALTVIALLASASDVTTTDEDRQDMVRAYRWVSTLSTMLDSYVDQFEDRASGAWCAIDYYGSDVVAVERIGALIDRALREVGALRHGERHVVIVSAMIALFLSGDSARSPALAASTRTLVDAGGSVTRHLVPALRAWRTINRQRGV